MESSFWLTAREKVKPKSLLVSERSRELSLKALSYYCCLFACLVVRGLKQAVN